MLCLGKCAVLRSGEQGRVGVFVDLHVDGMQHMQPMLLIDLEGTQCCSSIPKHRQLLVMGCVLQHMDNI